MVTIKYNNENPFEGISQTPLVARREDYDQQNSKLARIDVFILRGRIKRTACSDGFLPLFTQVQSLIRKFSVNFKNFEIIENGTTVFSYPYAIIESIDFDEDKYFDLVPYTITIKCYKESFAELYGVTNVSEDYSFDENDGCIVSISHSLTCQGLNTNNSAYDNIRNFINSRAGYLPAFDPVGYSVVSPILTSRKESINNFYGQGSLNETFLFDKSNFSGTRDVIQKYEVNLAVSDGKCSVSVNGTIQGSINGNIDITRDYYQLSSVFAVALREYNIYNPTGSLNSNPISASFSENKSSNIITYNVVFGDYYDSDPYVIDATTITISEGIRCINCSLKIKSDIGCIAERSRKTQEYLDSLDIYDYVINKWNTYGDGSIISTLYDDYSVSYDGNDGSISVSITYCSNNTDSCNCLENIRYNLSFTDAIHQLVETPSLEGEGCYSIQDLNMLNRAKFGITGSARPSKCCEESVVNSFIVSLANDLLTKYFHATDIILDEYNISYSSDKSVVNFTFSWNGYKSMTMSEDIFYGIVNNTGDNVSNLLLADGGRLLLTTGGFLIL